MPLDLSRSHPRLGALQATYQIDPVVLRHLRLCRFLRGLGAVFVLAAFAALSSLPWGGSLVLFFLAAAVFAGGIGSHPSSKIGTFLYPIRAPKRCLTVEVFADGFVIGEEERAHRWEDVIALRHPLFRGSLWARDEGQPCYHQKTLWLFLELPGGAIIELTDVIVNVEALNQTIQREVYPRLLEGARRRRRDGRAEPFATMAIREEGIHIGAVFLAWPEIALLELKETTLRLNPGGGSGQSVDVAQLPNFPVFLALLEEHQPRLARDVLEGLPLDSVAALWQRAARLREAPTPPKDGTVIEPGPPAIPSAAPDHTGRTHRSTADFFVPAPPEIGPLISAGTTLARGDRPIGIAVRLLLVLLSIGLLGGLGLVIVSAGLAASEFWRTIWLAGLPLGAGLLVFVATRFRHTCTYVGTEGVAIYRCSGQRSRLIERTLFLFRDAAVVYSSSKHRYNKGYRGSDYLYVWRTELGRKVFEIEGTYHSEKEPPPPTDQYHFGESAEVAWSLFRLAAVQEELDRTGCVRFERTIGSGLLTRSAPLRVGPGFIDFGEEDGGYCSVDDLAETTVKDNVLCFRRSDAEAGWFTSRGICKVALNGVANPRLFLFLVRTLVAFGSTDIGENGSRREALLDQLAAVANVTWHNDPRVVTFVCKSLAPGAAEHALQHLRRGSQTSGE